MHPAWPGVRRTLLAKDPDVKRWSTYGGARRIRYLPLDVQLPNDFFAQTVIVAQDMATGSGEAGEGAGSGLQLVARIAPSIGRR